MTLTVTKRLRRRIQRDPGGILVQIRKSSDPEGAAAALAAARADIAALDGGPESAPGLLPGSRNAPKYVGPVLRSPSGPLLYVDGGYTPEHLLSTIPDLVVRHLAARGVADAVVDCPAIADAPFDLLARTPKAVTLRLYPPPPGSRRGSGARRAMPENWLDAATAWVRDGMSDDAELWVNATLRYRVAAADGRAVFGFGRRTGLVSLLAGDVDRRVRGTSASFARVDGLAIGAGGPASTDDQLRTIFNELVEIGRRLVADVAYAYVTIDATAAHLGGVHVGTEWDMLQGGAGSHTVELLCDEIVFDAFPWQVLGPGHLRRVAAAGATLQQPGLTEGPTPLGGERLELSIGSFDDWLVDRPADPARSWIDVGYRRRDPRVQQAARDLLAPCLMSHAQARDLYSARVAFEEAES